MDCYFTRPVFVPCLLLKYVIVIITVNEANDCLEKPLKCTVRTLEETVEKCLRAARERRGIPAEQRPTNACPVAEWLRPEAIGALTNWTVTGRNGVINHHVVKSSFVLNKVLHCILKNNDKTEGVMHGDFLDACGWTGHDKAGLRRQRHLREYQRTVAVRKPCIPRHKEDGRSAGRIVAPGVRRREGGGIRLPDACRLACPRGTHGIATALFCPIPIDLCFFHKRISGLKNARMNFF